MNFENFELKPGPKGPQRTHENFAMMPSPAWRNSKNFAMMPMPNGT